MVLLKQAQLRGQVAHFGLSNGRVVIKTASAYNPITRGWNRLTSSNKGKDIFRRQVMTALSGRKVEKVDRENLLQCMSDHPEVFSQSDIAIVQAKEDMLLKKARKDPEDNPVPNTTISERTAQFLEQENNIKLEIPEDTDLDEELSPIPFEPEPLKDDTDFDLDEGMDSMPPTLDDEELDPLSTPVPYTPSKEKVSKERSDYDESFNSITFDPPSIPSSTVSEDETDKPHEWPKSKTVTFTPVPTINEVDDEDETSPEPGIPFTASELYNKGPQTTLKPTPTYSIPSEPALLPESTEELLKLETEALSRRMPDIQVVDASNFLWANYVQLLTKGESNSQAMALQQELGKQFARNRRQNSDFAYLQIGLMWKAIKDIEHDYAEEEFADFLKNTTPEKAPFRHLLLGPLVHSIWHNSMLSQNSLTRHPQDLVTEEQVRLLEQIKEAGTLDQFQVRSEPDNLPDPEKIKNRVKNELHQFTQSTTFQALKSYPLGTLRTAVHTGKSLDSEAQEARNQVSTAYLDIRMALLNRWDLSLLKSPRYWPDERSYHTFMNILDISQLSSWS